jgi:superfamily II DNA or RNA helicase
MSTERAYYRVGMSGTPLARGDQKSLLTIGALGPVISEVAPETLIQQGWLSRPVIRMEKIEQHSDHKTYAGAYGALVVKSKPRNRLVASMMKRSAKPNLTFVKNIEHGRFLTAMAKAQGMQIEFVWGNKSTKERQAAISRLIRGDIDCIISSKVFFVGVDIPELLSVVIATAGQSVIETLQRIGRGMRVVEGKNTFEVWDVYDTGHRNMETHARARKRAYEQEGHGVTVVDGTE